jgi:hypothetical protein
MAVSRNELSTTSLAGALATAGSGFIPPVVIAAQGDKAAERFFTFFADTIPNPNTRAAYYRNTMRFFAWAEKKNGSGSRPSRVITSPPTSPSWPPRSPRPLSGSTRPASECSRTG